MLGTYLHRWAARALTQMASLLAMKYPTFPTLIDCRIEETPEPSPEKMDDKCKFYLLKSLPPSRLI
jgi:hypothetical protein